MPRAVAVLVQREHEGRGLRQSATPQFVRYLHDPSADREPINEPIQSCAPWHVPPHRIAAAVYPEGLATRAAAVAAPAAPWIYTGSLENHPELVARICSHAMRHAYANLSLDAGVSERDLQDAMRHKDPRTTRRYDRSRGVLDRSPGYTLAAYLSAASDAQ